MSSLVARLRQQLSRVVAGGALHRRALAHVDEVLAAFRAGFAGRLVPRYEVALRIPFAAVERPALARPPLHDLPLMAGRALDADLRQQRPRVPAVGEPAAGEE